jgi:class 3 adenylate cyclase
MRATNIEYNMAASVERIDEILSTGDASFEETNTVPNRDTLTHNDEVFSTVAKVASLIDIWNQRLNRIRQLPPIAIGIGMDYGRALMIKAGHKGSTINDVVWMGDVVNSAAKLGSYGSRSPWNNRVMLSRLAYDNLNESNRTILTYHATLNCWHGSVVNVGMNDWLHNNR